MLILLTGIFLAQTWFVYTDPAGRKTPALSEVAQRGQSLWHSRNCQACHQIYGFGGFLGPDLTNLASRMAPAEEGLVDAPTALAEALTNVLTMGSQQMPAFHMGAEDRVALAAFFVELDKTGVGLLQARQPRTAKEELAAQVAMLPERSEESAALFDRGYALVVAKDCISCHLPNQRSLFRAPDLTHARASVDRERLETVLTVGDPEKGMPAMNLDAAEIEAVLVFLQTLGESGAKVRRGFEASARSTADNPFFLPWFEYP